MLTVAELRNEASGTLAGWLDGYTDARESDGMQHRIRVYQEQDDGSVIYTVADVEQLGEDVSTAQFFRIRVEVERVLLLPDGTFRTVSDV